MISKQSVPSENNLALRTCGIGQLSMATVCGHSESGPARSTKEDLENKLQKSLSLNQHPKMVRELNMDTQRQNFWKESINKEAFVRLAWHARYSKEFVRDAAAMTTQKPRNEGLKINALQALKEEMEAKEKKEEESRKKVEETAKQNPESLLVEMRPVSRDTREVLYDGFSALGGGRYAYLQKRKLKAPEVKYEFPITSSWEVGWKLQDCVKQQKSPSFGRTRVIRDTFYRPGGILYVD